MCHSKNKRIYNLTIRSSDAVSSQTFDCSGFCTRYIKQNRKYKMKVVYFGTTGNQGNVSNVVVHMPFFQTENSQVDSSGEVMTTPTLILHHQPHGTHLVYTGDAQAEYVGTVSTNLFKIDLTTQDMTTAFTLQAGTSYLIQLQFEEEDD